MFNTSHRDNLSCPSVKPLLRIGDDMTLARKCLFTTPYVVSYTVLLKVRLNYLKFTENQDFTKG